MVGPKVLLVHTVILFKEVKCDIHFLTTGKIGRQTRFMPNLLYVMTNDHIISFNS